MKQGIQGPGIVDYKGTALSTQRQQPWPVSKKANAGISTSLDKGSANVFTSRAKRGKAGWLSSRRLYPNFF